ncbi:MAG TPA: hypothetical protein VHF65_04655 [Nitrososphaera sp.]|nr:hypothetical protein [Nitrososphaera sp.]
MPFGHTKDESEKPSNSQDLEDNKKKRTEKNREPTITMTPKPNAFDLTKSDNTPTGIIDILDEPDVAVWSKGIMNKTNTPADKVQEPSHIKSIATHIGYREEEELEQKESHLQQTVDPANKEEVDKVIELGTSLTDEATTSIQRSKKETSS